MITKLIRGDKLRRTRLHDEKGNCIAWRDAFLHGPLAGVTGVLRLTIGYRPTVPWISYTVIRLLRDFLSKESRVLEFGSGMSTVWYALRAQEVCSVEDYLPWYKKVDDMLITQGLNNVTYKFAETASDYYAFMANDRSAFNLIMIDGSHRSKCVENALTLLRPGGILYLDNSDKDSSPGGGDMRCAEQRALEFAKYRDAQVSYFTDFAPTQFFVQQGMMIRLPKE
jgi:predicted O-methyltransferase YrrM